MKLEQLTEIGRVQRTHGLTGKLKVQFDSFYNNDLPKLSALVIQKGEDFLPFFIESIEHNSNFSLIELESLKTKEDAAKLNGKKIFAISNQLNAVKENQLDLLLNINLFDQTNQLVGKIEEVIEMPNQILLQLTVNQNEVLIPFHEELIIEISQNKLQLEIPEGLLDIYR